MTGDPAAEAVEELRRHQEAMGMAFENPDKVVPAEPSGDGMF
jgi:hypothetical protein